MSGIGVAAVARAAPGERSSTAPGRIRQGADGSEPESAPLAWIAMMFSAGLGIGLVFHGVGEPLRHFLDPPPASGVPVGTGPAALSAMEFVPVMPGLCVALREDPGPGPARSTPRTVRGRWCGRRSARR
nr:BCCT family transporter [Streptomyces sp.]